MSKTYITTAIPYANGAPHIGHAMDYLLADVFARYCRMIGQEVRFQTGTDEHGSKIFQKAEEKGLKVEDYVAENVKKYQDFIEKMDISATDFIRTTDEDHIRRCKEIWKKLEDHIYLGKYDGWYCEGCEAFVTQGEYDENSGICPDHKTPYKKLEEENYYLRADDFRERIREAILDGEMKILPEFRKKEVLKLLDDTPDISISRPKKQLSWGIDVPDDDSQVMYVWIDALTNYVTVLGYPEEDISDFWPAEAQFVGKDVLRFHAIIWPMILLGVGLPLPKVIHSHGHVLANGHKMSKTVGNVVDPMEVVEKYGLSAFRYFFLRHIDTFADSDFTWEKFDAAYNNELANDLGNLVQRLATMARKNGVTGRKVELELDSEYEKMMSEMNFVRAFDVVWQKIQDLNRKIDEEKPWVLAKAGRENEAKLVLGELVDGILEVAGLLVPFLPETSKEIQEIFEADEILPPKTPLFPKEARN